jgi:hypothetical protein
MMRMAMVLNHLAKKSMTIEEVRPARGVCARDPR